MNSFKFVLLCQCLVTFASGARILGIFPHPGKSHFDVFQVLLEGLAEKGHNVTVVGFFPHKNPPKGYHDISLEGLLPVYTNAIPVEAYENPLPDFLRPFSEFNFLTAMGLEACEAVLPSPQIQNLLKAKGDFDIVIIEEFDTDCFLPIPHKLEVPYIGISSCTNIEWLNRRMGNPIDASYVNNSLAGLGSKMNLLERIFNTIFNAATGIMYPLLMQAPAQKLAEKYIGNVPPLEDLARNTSLMLTNSHFALNQAKPQTPAVVEIGGIHVRKPKPLPKELNDFVEGAEHGVIVFSMGSILNPATLSESRKSALLNVFRSLPQRIVWKYGGEIENLPSNVKTMSWLPQRDILAHPNVRAFMAHGGLLGMTEAVASGVPLVVIPMFGDQHTNARTAKQIGVAVELPFTNINEKTVTEALQTVLSDKYQKRANELSREFLDRPVPPLDLAIYWVEYVLRHGGTSLRSAAVDLTVVQYYLLDVISVIAAAFLAVAFILRKCFQVIFKLLVGKKEKVKTQ